MDLKLLKHRVEMLDAVSTGLHPSAVVGQLAEKYGVFVAGGVGFEPTTTGLGGLRPILTRLPAHAFRHCLTSLVL